MLGDDLDGASHAPERRPVCVRRAFDLDPVAAHQAPARESPSVGEREGFAAPHDRLEGFRARHGGAAVEPEGRAHGAYLFGVEHAPDEGLAGRLVAEVLPIVAFGR